MNGEPVIIKKLQSANAALTMEIASLNKDYKYLQNLCERQRAENDELKARLEKMRKKVKEIAKGEGAFSRDNLKHAENCIENMKSLANDTLKELESGSDMGIRISEFQKEDQRKVFAFCKRIFHEVDADWNYSQGLDDIAGYFISDRSIFLVAKDGDIVIGCGGVKELDANRALLKRLYIQKEFRSSGIGSEILSMLEKFCTKMGYKEMMLETAKENHAALAFYAKHHYICFEPEEDDNWLETKAKSIFVFMRKICNESNPEKEMKS